MSKKDKRLLNSDIKDLSVYATQFKKVFASTSLTGANPVAVSENSTPEKIPACAKRL